MKRWIGIAGVVALSACAATPTLVPPGTYDAGGAYSVTLERSWTEMPERRSPFTDTSYLTFDGPRLNQVYVLSGIPSGSGIIKERRSDDEDIAELVFRSGMSELELVEFVTESIALFGYQDVVAQDVRPATLAGSEGVQFVITAAQGNGLRIKGAALASETDGTLDLMLFIAPEMHYYGALMPEVERMFASAARR